mmetsp:Transcript_46618/g.110866  ORF Transcript_46618/g.110866 Transcript_46618/m.110866 type:complete len:264 (-) Transcript_46618:588-1379(-)
MPDPQLSALLHLPHGGLDLLQHQLQQRGLSRAVGPYQGHAGIQVHSQFEALVKVVLFLARVGKRHVGEGHDRRRDLLGVGEGKLVSWIFHGLLCQSRLHHLVDDLLLGFSLHAQVCVGAAGANKFLQVLDVLLLLLVLGQLVLFDLRPGFDVLVVVAAPHNQGSFLRELHDVGAHTVHEVLRVRGEQQRVGVAGQILLQPHAGPKVQVIRGLVQEQQHGLYKERLRQRHAHPPAAGHVLRRLLHHGLGEAQAVQQLAGPRLEG